MADLSSRLYGNGASKKSLADRLYGGQSSAQAPFANGPLKMGAESFPDQLRQELENAGWAGRNLAGMGSAVVNAYQGLKGAIPRLDSDPNQVRDQNIIADSAPVGNIAGNVAMLAPTALIPGANTVTGAATIGAVQGALLTPGDIKARAMAAGLGAAGGAVGAGASKVFGAARPIVRNQDAGVLAKEGIRLTPGQNAGGFLKTLEDRMTSSPLVGDVIQNARRSGLEDFNKAALNRVANQVGANVDDVGRQGFAATKEAMGSAYDDLLPKLNNISKDAEFDQAMQQLRAMSSNMPKEKADQLNNMLNNYVESRFTPAGRMSGSTMKEVESSLGQESLAYRKSLMPDDRKLGDALRQAQENLRAMVERTNPNNKGELQKINKAYADYAILRKAASMGGTASNEGLFTPAQLNSAVRAADSSAGKGRYASGTARLQDLTDPAMSLLPSKVPESGTAGRLMSDLTNPFNWPGLAGKAALSIPLMAAYSRPGSAVINGAMNNGAIPLAELVRSLGANNPNLLRLLGTALPGEMELMR